MFRDLQAAYSSAAQDIDADYMIPSGAVFQAMLKSGSEKLHRDTFHASRGLGRYALGLTWYAALTDRDVRDNAFADLDEAVPQEQRMIAKNCVMQLMTNMK